MSAQACGRGHSILLFRSSFVTKLALIASLPLVIVSGSASDRLSPLGKAHALSVIAVRLGRSGQYPQSVLTVSVRMSAAAAQQGPRMRWSGQEYNPRQELKLQLVVTLVYQAKQRF